MDNIDQAIKRYEQYNAYALDCLIDAQSAINEAVSLLSKGNDLLADGSINDAVNFISEAKLHRKQSRNYGEIINKEEV